MKPPTSGGFFLEQNNGTKCNDLGAERLGILGNMGPALCFNLVARTPDNKDFHFDQG
jgi:hypothetical protein